MDNDVKLTPHDADEFNANTLQYQLVSTSNRPIWLISRSPDKVNCKCLDNIHIKSSNVKHYFRFLEVPLNKKVFFRIFAIA